MSEAEFRDEARKLVDEKRSKIWLACIQGHRLDFLCSVGGEQLKPTERLAREGSYILLGQQVPADRLPGLRALFARFVRNQVAAPAAP